MKEQMSIEEIAAMLKAQKSNKQDFICGTQELRMIEKSRLASGTDSYGEYALAIGRKGYFGVTATGHRQIAERIQIPWTYYKRSMTTAPRLHSDMVNFWHQHEPKVRLVRTMYNDARAVLSDKYRPLDNYDLAEAVVPLLMGTGMELKSCAITDSKLYLKAVSERIVGEVRVGDVVQAGVCISNSEIGQGSVKVEPLVFRLSCKNGMIVTDHSFNARHVGRAYDNGTGGVEQFYRDETRQADDKALWMKVRDVVSGTLDQVRFDKLLAGMREATTREMTANPVGVTDVTQKMFSLTDDEKGGVLDALIRGGDLTQFGLSNAVTRHSQDVDDYDRATNLERIGGEIMVLTQPKWGELVAA